jgi:hypothetical protein
MTMSKLILCVALLTATGPAAAAAAVPPVANQVASIDQGQQIDLGGGAKTVVPAAVKKVCKNLPSSYTRMTERVCLTRQQWEQVQREVDGR